jgi:hypothetical protein
VVVGGGRGGGGARKYRRGQCDLFKANAENEVDAVRDAGVGDEDLLHDQLLTPGGEVQPTPSSSADTM